MEDPSQLDAELELLNNAPVAWRPPSPVRWSLTDAFQVLAALTWVAIHKAQPPLFADKAAHLLASQIAGQAESGLLAPEVELAAWSGDFIAMRAALELAAAAGELELDQAERLAALCDEAIELASQPLAD